MSEPERPPDSAPPIRIGELARRAGIPAGTVRAWERRYGIVGPVRSESGYRLYSARDEARLKEMVALIAEGAAPAEAARRVSLSPPDPGRARPPAQPDPSGPDSPDPRAQLLDGLRAFDEAAANAAIDRAVADYSLEALLEKLILPVLHRIGELWRAGEVSVGEEHFATALIRGRLLGLARGWGTGVGPRALLACPEGEMHDLGLVAFGLLLRAHGWRVAFLGADTPTETVAASARRLRPALVVLALTSPEPARALAERDPEPFAAPLVVAGSAATPELAEHLGGELVGAGLVAAAAAIASRG